MRGAKYRALTAQQIKPEGWLLRQLEIQAEGSKRMAAPDYFRGHPVQLGEHLG